VIVVEPGAFVVTIPPVAMVATSVADELQVTELVMSLELPSVNPPVALNCSVVFVRSDRVTALT
jgi:hypothetical protein